MSVCAVTIKEILMDVLYVRKEKIIGADHDCLTSIEHVAPPRRHMLQPSLVRDGFEPSKATPADLQSAPFGRSGTSP
jgi:hypothetical protein